MTKEESEVEAGVRLASACCVAYILRNYRVRYDGHLIVTLMKTLLLKPDVVNQKCAAYDQLVSVHLVSPQWCRFVFLFYVMNE